MTEIIYKELSYEIIGIVFEVYKYLGYGHRETYYHRAIAIELKKRNIEFEHEKEIPLYYKGNKIGKTFLDFVIEGRIILEIKVANSMKQKDVVQVLEYLRSSSIKLGIIAWITRHGVYYRRLVNNY